MLRQRLGGPAAGLLLVVLVPRVLLLPIVALSPDESAYALLGREILHGNWPYLVAFDHKPVGLYLPFALVTALVGENSTALRALCLVTALIGYVLTYVVARRMRMRQSVATGAAVLYSFLTLGNEGAAALSEQLVNVYVLMTLLMLVLGRAWWTAAAAGAFAGLAFGTNYIAAPTCLMLAAWLVWRERRHPLRILAAAGGSLLATAALLLPVYLWSDLTDYFELQLRFLTSYSSPDGGAALALSRWQHLLAPVAPLIAIGLVFAALSVGSRSWPVRRWAALLAVTIAAVSANGFFYPHYAMLLAIPITFALATQLREWDPPQRVPVLSVLVLVSAWTLLLPMATTFVSAARSIVRQHDLAPDRSQPAMVISAAVEEFTDPGDVIYSPEPAIYHLTGTEPPIRFFFPDHHLEPAMTAALGTSVEEQMRSVVDKHPVAVVIGPTIPIPPEASAVLEEYVGAQCRLHRQIGRTQVLDCR